MSRRFLCIALLSGLTSSSGCAIYTPFAVHRLWFDWNSEREINLQAESFDHLPPKPLRVKLMRWGYNTGQPDSYVPPRGWFGQRRWKECPPNAVVMGPAEVVQEMPPPSAIPVPPPDAAAPQLPIIPPAPPAEPARTQEDFGPLPGPSANRDSRVRTAGHRPDGRTGAATAAWIFRSGGTAP